jgi:hypothetical protein
LVGEFEGFEFQWTSGYLAEKRVEVSREVLELEGGKVWEPVE